MNRNQKGGDMSKELFIVVTTTAPDRDVARKISGHLLGEHLAASVQILGPIESAYWWEETLHHRQEWLCIIKTTEEARPRVERAIFAVHPYVTPEIFATPITGGATDYLAWIRRYVKP